MSQFSIKASFDGTELIQGFKDVKSELNGLKTAGDNAGKSLDQMLQQKNSTSNYSRQLGQIKQQLTDLAVNYSRLSDADKNSDFGVAMAARIDELTAKAQELKGVMDDVNSSLSGGSGGPKDYGEHWAEIQRQAEQTYAKFEGVQKVSAGVASGFAAIQGAAALLGDENEDLQKALLKVQSAMAIAQGIGGIKDLFEGLKQLKAAFTFTTAATIADTAATNTNTAATKTNTAATTAATVAQKGFNTAVKANPYILLATAIVAAGAALVSFAKKTKEAEKEQEEYNKRIEEQKQKENERKDVINSSVGEIIGKYKLLQYHWNQLSSDQEKNRWISENQSAFNDLGIAINDVNTAQKVFVEYSELVVKALKDQAKARALSQLYEEAIVTQYKADKNLETEEDVAERKYPAGYKPSKSEVKAAGLNENTDYNKVYAENSYWDQWVNGKEKSEMKSNGTVNWSGAYKLQENYLKGHEQAAEQAAADVAKIEQAYIEAEKAAAQSAAALKDVGINHNSGASSSGGSTSGTTTKTEDIFAADSLRAAQQEVQNLQDKLNRMSPNDAAFDTTLQQLNEAKAKVRELQEKMKEPVTPLTKTEQLIKTYEDAGKQINNIAKQHEIGLIDVETAKKQIDKINKELQKLGLNPIEIKLKTSDDIQRGKTLEYRNQQSSKAQNISVEYEAGIITYGVAKKAIDEINEDLAKLGLKPLELKIDDGSLAAFQERYESTMSVMDSSASIISSVGSAFGAVVSAINDENTALGSVVGTLDEGSKSWLEWGVNSVNTIAQVLPQIASIIMAQQAQALAGGIASGASLPFPANMAVIASVVAALLAMFASLPKFATGGIVNGSLIGDMNLARVNGGEMILNGRQQTNLFRMLDQNRLHQFGGGSADVNFRIKGDTLIGVIDNYNKKHGRG